MNARTPSPELCRRVLDNFDLLAEAPGGVPKLRELILQLAVRGQLVPQDSGDEPAQTLVKAIDAERERRIQEGYLRNDAEQPAPSLRPLDVLPYGWVLRRFGSLVYNRDGERVPISRAHRESRRGEYDYYGASGVIDKIDGFLFDQPLLLIGEDGANLVNRSTPIAFIATGKYWVNNHAHVLEAINNDLLNYLALFINATDLLPYITGTAQPKMNQAKMNSIPVFLPPLAEQKRIVAKVDELMKRCDELEARQNERNERHTVLVSSCLHALANSKASMPSLALRSLGEGGILQPSTFNLLVATRASVAELRKTILQLAVQGRLVTPQQDEWPRVTVRDVATRIHYGYTASANPALNNVRLLRITDIQDNRVNWGTVPGCEIEEENVPKYELHPGDILIARTGGTIGKTFLISDTPVRAVFASYLIRVIPSERVVPPYLKLFLESPDYWEQLRMKSAGTGQPNVNSQALGSLELALPPLAEQKSIVAKVSELMSLCDALEAKLTQSRADAGTLAAAIVHHLCNGSSRPQECSV